MTSQLVETFAATIGSPLVWLSALVVVFLVPRPWTVRAAAAAVATGLAFMDWDYMAPLWQGAAETIVAGATGLLVGQVVLGLVVPAILLTLATLLRGLTFARKAIVFIRGGTTPPTPPAPPAGTRGPSS